MKTRHCKKPLRWDRAYKKVMQRRESHALYLAILAMYDKAWLEDALGIAPDLR